MPRQDTKHGTNLTGNRKKSKGRNPPALDPAFARRLREVMQARTVRPGELARLVPIDATSVSRWRRGHVPPPSQIARIADVLDTPLNWLKSGLGTMNGPVGTAGQGEGAGERQRGAVARAVYRMAEATNGDGRLPLGLAVTAVRGLAVELGVSVEALDEPGRP